MARMKPGTVVPHGVPFAQVPHDITLDREVTNAAYRVYGYLMKLANSEGRAWPGHRHIESMLPMSRKTVAAGIACLEATGWLVVHRDEQHHTYTVVGNRGRISAGVDMPPGENVPQTGVDIPPQLVENLPHIENQDREPDTDTQLAERDSVWDFFTHTDTFAMPAATKDQQRRVGKAVREVRAQMPDVGGYRNEWELLIARARAWPQHFPNATLTPEAYTKHFVALGRPPLRGNERDSERARTVAALSELEAS